jgi:hypothetical protein
MSTFEITPGIRTVRSRGDLKQFIKHPFEKYRSDPHWAPPLLIDERQKFNPKKNPFYEHARMELFLAERNGEILAGISPHARRARVCEADLGRGSASLMSREAMLLSILPWEVAYGS